MCQWASRISQYGNGPLQNIVDRAFNSCWVRPQKAKSFSKGSPTRYRQCLDAGIVRTEPMKLINIAFVRIRKMSTQMVRRLVPSERTQLKRQRVRGRIEQLQ